MGTHLRRSAHRWHTCTRRAPSAHTPSHHSKTPRRPRTRHHWHSRTCMLRSAPHSPIRHVSLQRRLDPHARRHRVARPPATHHRAPSRQHTASDQRRRAAQQRESRRTARRQHMSRHRGRGAAPRTCRMRWDEMRWDGMGWDGMRRDGTRRERQPHAPLAKVMDHAARQRRRKASCSRESPITQRAQHHYVHTDRTTRSVSTSGPWEKMGEDGRRREMMGDDGR
jgi:hypothetical protein